MDIWYVCVLLIHRFSSCVDPPSIRDKCHFNLFWRIDDSWDNPVKRDVWIASRNSLKMDTTYSADTRKLRYVRKLKSKDIAKADKRPVTYELRWFEVTSPEWRQKTLRIGRPFGHRDRAPVPDWNRHQLHWLCRGCGCVCNRPRRQWIPCFYWY